MLYVGTGINPGYYSTLQSYGYFEGLEALAVRDQVIPFAVLLDFPDEKFAELEWLYPGIWFIRMVLSEVKCPNPNACLQHGGFLDALSRVFEHAAIELEDTDYIIFTDGDIRIQRKFSARELQMLSTGEVLVAMNWHDKETLAEEFPALHPRVSLEALEEKFPGCRELRCFNTGVLGMTVQDWRFVFKLYCEAWPLIDPLLGHYAKQQWLLCYLIQRLLVRTLDPLSDDVRNIHSHGHTQQAVIDNRIQRSPEGVFHRDGTPLLFAHRLK